MHFYDIIRTMDKNNWSHLAALIGTAFLWGMAFVAQSLGADHVGPFTFLALRNWLGILVLMPLMMHTYTRSKLDTSQKKQVIAGGVICGLFLFLGSLFQQMGIAYTTTAKSGFITALYMILVPILSTFAGKKPSKQIWLSVIIGVVGLYLLCIHGTIASVNIGDVLTLICSFMFALQILAVNRFVKDCHPVLLSGIQFLTCAIIASICMRTETVLLSNIRLVLWPILYAGIFSTGIAYTLQIVGQRALNPAIASLVMCLESVFSALGGWLILGQGLSNIELTGCSLMFMAILFSQISFDRSFKKRM